MSDDAEDEAYDDNGFPRYTPEEYAFYLKAPQWVHDDCTSESDYVSSLCAKVKSWYDQSADEFRNEKEVWQACYKRLSDSQKSGVKASSILESAVAAAMFPIMRNTMLDQISSLYAGQYAPVYKGLSPKADQMMMLANRYLAIELKTNKWDTLKFDLGLDGWVADIWIMKLYADDEDPGPFGEDERMVIERIDPLNCYPDPKAARWHWPSMAYFIVEQSMEIGEAKLKFKDKAALINKSLVEPADEDKNKWGSSQLLVLTGQKKQWQAGIERQQIQIKECWIHDSRMQFRAYEENYIVINEDGGTETKVRAEVDDEGYVKGQWENAYPNGRMIVTAADKVILQDIPNPFWHKKLPYIACPMSPSAGRLFTVGKAAPILGIERKINDVETRVHAYMQSETERPMIIEQGALPTNAQWFSLGNQSRNIVIVNKGYQIYRPPPVEIPQFIPMYLGRLNAYRDQTAGQGGILKGEVAEGAQLSAESVMAMQGGAQGRLNMESVYIAGAMLEFGDKALWLMRQTYKKDMQCQVFTPSGEQETMSWNEADIGNDYFVDIDLAANQPGGQQAILNQAIQLKRESLVDRPYCLSVAGISGWEAIDKRMNDQKFNEIKAQAFARTFGINVKKADTADRGPVNKAK